jgi:hypothetical protein
MAPTLAIYSYQSQGFLVLPFDYGALNSKTKTLYRKAWSLVQ